MKLCQKEIQYADGKSMEIEELKGKTLQGIAVDKDEDVIIFQDKTGQKYAMYHDQDCCETVRIKDICGDLEDIIGRPILLAEKTTNSNDKEREEYKSYDSYTWTFYKLATMKGAVTISWFGESNGYYSEEVRMKKLRQKKEQA